MLKDDQITDHGWEITDPDHLALYRQAEPLLQTRFNTLHTRIAYHFALVLQQQVGSKAEIVIPAIMLHDVGWSAIAEKDQVGAFGPNLEKPELQRRHETEGARLARNILAKLGYPENCIRAVADIIDGHDTRLTTLGINDSVVKDADKMWRYTYEGFTVDCRRFNRTPGKYLDWLTRRIPEWFFTATAGRLAHAEAEKRRTELQNTSSMV